MNSAANLDKVFFLKAKEWDDDIEYSYLCVDVEGFVPLWEVVINYLISVGYGSYNCSLDHVISALCGIDISWANTYASILRGVLVSRGEWSMTPRELLIMMGAQIER